MLSTTILATCQACGNVKLKCSDLSIVVSWAGDGIFVFRCPICTRSNARSCERANVERLSDAGARCIDLGRRSTRFPPSNAPPLVIADVIRFTEALRHEDFLATVIAQN
jgi:hypothetical protein